MCLAAPLEAFKEALRAPGHSPACGAPQVIQASPGAAEGALRHLDMALLLGSSGVLQESIRTCIACLQQGSPRLPPQGPHGAQGQDGRPDQPQKKDGRQHGNANEEPTGRGGEMDGSGVDKERCTEARGSIVDHQQLQANEVQASSWAARPPGDRLEGLRAPSELGDSLRGARSGSERPSQSNGAEAPGLPDGAFGCWAVERRALPSLEEFLRDFMLPATPVVVTRAMAHWPALERWRDTAYLERVAGRRTVPVEVTRACCPLADDTFCSLRLGPFSLSMRAMPSSASCQRVVLYLLHWC